MALVYPVAANLFLGTPISDWAVNRRPERFRVEWRRAWSVWPGVVEVRGLRLHGRSNHVDWTVTAERGRGRIQLLALLDRRFAVSWFHAEGVRSAVRRGDEIPLPPERPEPPGDRDEKPDRPRPTWTIQLAGIQLDGVRDVSYNTLRLTDDSGRGRITGSFSFKFGGHFRMDGTRLAMPGSRFWIGRDLLADGLDVDAALAFDPFVPREHPGLEGWDFLSGSLAAHGRVPDLPFLARSGLAGADAPGRLAADLKVEHGELKPGSRAEVVLAPPTGAPVPFALTVAVSGEREAPLLLALQARGLVAGRIPGRTPVFQSGPLAASVRSPVLQLRRLFVTARELRDASNLSASPPLQGDLRAEDVRIDAPGTRAVLRATLDHAAGRMDFAALLLRQVDLDGLQADGVSAQLDLVHAPPAPPSSPTSAGAPGWSVSLANARLTGIREFGFGDLRLVGTSRAEGSFTYDPAGNLAVQRAAFELPSGSLAAAGQTVARALAVRTEVHIEPLVLGAEPGLGFLRHVSGRADARARISSLGFLNRYLDRVPWLALQGEGDLAAGVRLAAGRLEPGSTVAVTRARLRATLLDSLASGSGIVRVDVGAGSRPALRVELDRFGFADLRQPGRPDYLRGRNLRMAAASASPLDLASTERPEFDASLAFAGAEVPSLAVYDALLPPGTGFHLLSGGGRVGLQLTLSTATGQARGVADLRSDGARVEVQDVEAQGRAELHAPFSSPDFQQRHFDLDGARLTLDGVSYRPAGDPGAEAKTGWWARARIGDASVVWGEPLSLRAGGEVAMKDSGPLIALFAQKNRMVKWFDDVLSVEGVTARGEVRVGGGVVAVEPLVAHGGRLEVRSRLRFSKDRKSGDLLVRYGPLTAGVELRDGRRDLKLLHAREWFERGAGALP